MSDEETQEPQTSPAPTDEILVVRLSRRERKVTIEDEHNIATTYTIREMMGNSRDQWLNGMARRMKLDKSGTPVGVQEFSNLQASLIARCLYGVDNKLVPETVIAVWPSSAQRALFDICQELSGLVDTPKEELAKNS